MIQVFHVTKCYQKGVPSLDDVTLLIEKGEFVFLTGASGAGKTTLFRLLIREERPTEGQIVVNGRNVARLGRTDTAFFRREIGVVFQDFRLIPASSVFDNVALALEVRGEPQPVIRKRTSAILDRLGLYGKRHRKPVTLSGGEQQRVAIARALVGRPGLILADEPTGNLDAVRTMDIMDLLAQAHQAGTTVVVATHNNELVERLGYRSIHLDFGRVVASPARRPASAPASWVEG